jgi:hypothetical protein
MALTGVSTSVVDMSGDTTGLVIAKGTTAERDAISSPQAGMIRNNTETDKVEVYNGTAWRNLVEAGNTTTPLTVEYLVVAGGGAGGNGMGAGGGAGGLIHNYNGTALSLTVGTSYQVTVGNGATGSTSNVTANGGDSVFNTLTAIGGGGGSSLQMQRNGGTLNGAAGGSGGGSGATDGNTGSYPGIGVGGAAQQPSSVSGGYGNAGGNPAQNKGYYPGPGGGGAGGVGTTPPTTLSNGGAGGAGLQVDIDGNNYYWAGGGGGSGYYNATSAGAGGIGGGGGGAFAYGYTRVPAAGGGSAINSGSSGGPGTASQLGGSGGDNTGGGGGGAGWSGGAGGNGGSGVVILRYPSAYAITFQTGVGFISSTATLSATSEKVTTITAGSGTIQFT